jgi:hypothetical protein
MVGCTETQMKPLRKAGLRKLQCEGQKGEKLTSYA